MSTDAALTRIRRLLGAARLLAARDKSLGNSARQRLVGSTGLSPENVDACLEHCLETSASEEDLRRLCRDVPAAPTAHVLLSSNVFVAALRALCLATAASERVCVRPSRREPELVELLARALAEAEANAGTTPLFQIVNELAPQSGDHVYAYASAATLKELEHSYPAGVVLHAHGPGFGAAIVDARAVRANAELALCAQNLAWDTLLFDQRGCLSPRIVLVNGDAELAQNFAASLAQQLSSLGQAIPLGKLSPAERADCTRYRESMTYACQVFAAGEGLVSFDGTGHILTLPPGGRMLHVVYARHFEPCLRNFAPLLTTLGFAGDATLAQQLRHWLPHARLSPLGRMQCPPLDGPVDRRTQPQIL